MTTELLQPSEIVTNALEHAGGSVTTTVRLDDHTLRVEVADDSREHPVVRHSAPSTTSGRGMDIVEAVTDTWGVEDIADDVKVVRSPWRRTATRPRLLLGLAIATPIQVQMTS
jgi:anti-sigma regulatory factor (Ser/Thr protein kinase)